MEVDPEILKELEDNSKKPKKKRKDKRIEKEYFEEVELIDPKTGEKVIQKVKITRYKAVGSKPVGNKGIPDEEIDLEIEEDV